MKKIILSLLAVGWLASCSSEALFQGTTPGGAEIVTRSANTNITLVRANSTTTKPSTYTNVNRTFTIKVKNLSSTKSVYLRHAKSNGTWVDIPASYLQGAEAGYEIWTAATTWSSQTSGTNPYGNAFCFKMVAGGVTYWDNNGGANYTLAQHGGELLGPDVNVSLTGGATYKAFETQKAHFTGAIDIRNIALTKKVTILYTLDSWATQKTAQAVYNSQWTPSYGAAIPSPNTYGVENWTFDVDTGAAVATVYYAIKYEVAGQTYWDNNGGANYKAVVRF